MIQTKIFNDYWIYARRQVGTYPAHTARSGKWVINIDQGDNNNNNDGNNERWIIIKNSTINGLLGNVSKISTGFDNNNRIIYVCTYDYQDIEDVIKIRNKLKDLGFVEELIYKTDLDTKLGKCGSDVYNF